METPPSRFWSAVHLINAAQAAWPIVVWIAGLILSLFQGLGMGISFLVALGCAALMLHISSQIRRDPSISISIRRLFGAVDHQTDNSARASTMSTKKIDAQIAELQGRISRLSGVVNAVEQSEKIGDSRLKTLETGIESLKKQQVLRQDLENVKQYVSTLFKIELMPTVHVRLEELYEAAQKAAHAAVRAQKQIDNFEATPELGAPNAAYDMLSDNVNIWNQVVEDFSSLASKVGRYPGWKEYKFDPKTYEKVLYKMRDTQKAIEKDLADLRAEMIRMERP